MKYLLTLALFALTGCAVPMLTGLKEIDHRADGSTRYVFMTGADVHFGANGIDRVADKRGIQP